MMKDVETPKKLGDRSAFPKPEYFHRDGTHFLGSGGMTLRQWYAGIALSGILADPRNTSPASAADLAFEYADAILAESLKDAK